MKPNTQLKRYEENYRSKIENQMGGLFLKLKKGIGASILLLLCFAAQAQNYDQAINDLKQELKAHPTEDEKRVDLLNDLSYAYRRSSPNKIDSFAKEALRLAEVLNYQKGMGIAYKNMGIAKYKLGVKTDSVVAFYQKCSDFAKQGQDYYSQAACSNNIGLVLARSLRYSEAIKAYQNALEIHTAHFSVDRLRLLIIGNIGETYYGMEDYEKAEVYFEEFTDLAEKHDNYPTMVMYAEYAGLVKYKQGKVDEAIETITKYLQITEDLGDYMTLVQAINSLSDILIKEKQFDKAVTYIEEGLEVAEKHNFPPEKCALTLNLSRVLFEKKRFVEAQKFGENAY